MRAEGRAPPRIRQCGADAVSACSRAHRREPHRSPGRAGPSSSARARDRDRADEAAEARTVRAEDDRHVAGEIDGADRVRVVVNVRRMQARLAAVRRAHCGFGPISRTPVRSEL